MLHISFNAAQMSYTTIKSKSQFFPINSYLHFTLHVVCTRDNLETSDISGLSTLPPSLALNIA